MFPPSPSLSSSNGLKEKTFLISDHDKKEETIKDKTLSLDAQLATVKAHVEDLEVFCCCYSCCCYSC
jgi:hypothetical protein